MGKIKVTAYEEFVEDSGYMPLSDLTYSFIGLAGETGECMEWLKKRNFRRNDKYTDEMLKLELGDVIHYVTRIARFKGWTLKELMAANVEKLQQRRKQVV